MTLSELTQFNDLRTALKSIDAQMTAIHLAVSSFKERIDDAYFAACATLDTGFDEDNGANKEAEAKLRERTPFSMHLGVPDKGYAADGMGDLTATTMV